MAGPRNVLPFEYLIRGAPLEYLHGSEHAKAVEQRDAELEDFLGRVGWGEWTPFAYINSWAAATGAGFSVPGWRREGDRIYCRGAINNGTMGVAAIALPKAARPLFVNNIASMGAGFVPINLRVEPLGVFMPQGSVATARDFVELDNVSWPLS